MRSVFVLLVLVTTVFGVRIHSQPPSKTATLTFVNGCNSSFVLKTCIQVGQSTPMMTMVPPGTHDTWEVSSVEYVHGTCDYHLSGTTFPPLQIVWHLDGNQEYYGATEVPYKPHVIVPTSGVAVYWIQCTD